MTEHWEQLRSSVTLSKAHMARLKELADEMKMSRREFTEKLIDSVYKRYTEEVKEK